MEHFDFKPIPSINKKLSSQNHYSKFKQIGSKSGWHFVCNTFYTVKEREV